MQLEINKVFATDLPEHKDVIRKSKIFVDSIASISEAISNKKYTILKTTDGDEFSIAEKYTDFEKRYEGFIERAVAGFKNEDGEEGE